jgi:hypothetical protein
MPALIGYMLAIVVMLGGYLVGLQWLVSPPDPWKPNPLQTQQLVAKKRPPAKPAQADDPAIELITAGAANGKLEAADTEPPASPALVAKQPEAAREPAQAVARATALQVEPAIVERRSPAVVKPVIRRVEKKQHVRPILMVLRTYERSDGTRFSRLLPISSVRHASYQAGDW